jgi:lipopolysaccharide/colanic/teichoic acid biosynthesis glycosyltransferase
MTKRLFDIVFAFVCLMLFFPLGVMIALILKFTGEGEVFYIHERVGKDGKIFGLIKFATMLKNSPNLGTGDVTVANDSRVLSFGRFLRKTKLNEVPQLMNVLKGDISIVGPRPLAPKSFIFYPKEIQDEIIQMTPGLTGIGSIVFRNEEVMIGLSGKNHIDCYKEDIAPYKGRLEMWYRNSKSFWLDLKLIFLTGWVVFFPNSRIYSKILKGLPEKEY